MPWAIEDVKHRALLHAIQAFTPRSSTPMVDAINAYEKALWQPVGTMPESGCFLAQTLGGEIELVRAWQSFGTTVTPGMTVWSVGTSHTTSRDRWRRWRPLPDAWSG